MQNTNKLALPDIEKVCSKVHDNWIDNKKAQGTHTKLTPEGKELMVPYDQLDEDGKNIVRERVNAVYKAIEETHEEVNQPTGQKQAATQH